MKTEYMMDLFDKSGQWLQTVKFTPCGDKWIIDVMGHKNGKLSSFEEIIKHCDDYCKFYDAVCEISARQVSSWRKIG